MEIWRCTHCREPIGIYEPVVIIGDGFRVTSRAAEPDLPYEEGARAHRECHARATDAGAGHSEPIA